MKETQRKRHKRGSVFVWLQLLVTILVIGVLYISDMMPINFLVVSSAILLILFFFSWGMCHSYRSRSAGRVLAVLITMVLGLLSFYLIKTQSILQKITGSDTRTDEMSVIVLNTDPAQSLQDAAGYTFGMVPSSDGGNTDKALSDIRDIIGDPATAAYATYTEEAQGLLNGEVGAIVFNEAYREMVNELYPGFTDQTRVLHTITIKTVIDISGARKNVTKECFTVYISGIDVYGDISKTSRSDVNIIATVNPNTRQVLLVSTPRDYYVPLAFNGEYDKLTHAGVYGVDESMRTLENLYGIQLDYYMRVNFTGFVDIINAIGGITVDSDYEFTSIDGYYFYQGANELDGEAALAFARERKAFAEGDLQRGRNQMKVISAIIQKAMSPAILNSYSSILDSVEGCFETSMASSSISSLVKMQLADGGEWNVVTYNVGGYGDSRSTYSYGDTLLSVVIPDQTTVDTAAMKMQQVRNGEIIAQDGE